MLVKYMGTLMSKTSKAAEDDQVLSCRLLQLTMKLGAEDAAAIREAAQRLNTLSAAVSDLRSGRVTIVPKTRQHALQLYCIAESTLRRMQDEDTPQSDQIEAERHSIQETACAEIDMAVVEYPHKVARAQRH